MFHYFINRFIHRLFTDESMEKLSFGIPLIMVNRVVWLEEVIGQIYITEIELPNSPDDRGHSDLFHHG